MTLLNCINNVTPEGWVLLSIAIGCAIYALYDLDKMNRRSAKEAREELQDLTESEKQKLEQVMYQRSQLKPRTRTTVIAVQLSLL